MLNNPTKSDLSTFFSSGIFMTLIGASIQREKYSNSLEKIPGKNIDLLRVMLEAMGNALTLNAVNENVYLFMIIG